MPRPHDARHVVIGADGVHLDLDGDVSLGWVDIAVLPIRCVKYKGTIEELHMRRAPSLLTVAAGLARVAILANLAVFADHTLAGGALHACAAGLALGAIRA